VLAALQRTAYLSVPVVASMEKILFLILSEPAVVTDEPMIKHAGYPAIV